MNNAQFTSGIGVEPTYSGSRAKGIASALSAPRSVYGAGASAGAYAKALANMNKLATNKRMAVSNLENSLKSGAARSNDIQDLSQLYTRGQLYGANQRNTARDLSAAEQANQIGNTAANFGTTLNGISALAGLLLG